MEREGRKREGRTDEETDAVAYVNPCSPTKKEEYKQDP